MKKISFWAKPANAPRPMLLLSSLLSSEKGVLYAWLWLLVGVLGCSHRAGDNMGNIVKLIAIHHHYERGQYLFCAFHDHPAPWGIGHGQYHMEEEITYLLFKSAPIEHDYYYKPLRGYEVHEVGEGTFEATHVAIYKDLTAFDILQAFPMLYDYVREDHGDSSVQPLRTW